MSTIAHARSHAMTHAWRGAVAGIVGGIVFGIVMAMTGMLPMVAMLVGSDNAVIGAVVHLAIAAAIGVLFGLLAGAIGDRVWPVMAAGLVYGVAWWVVGGLVLMPAFLGMALFPMGATSMWSLFGHALFGLVAGATLYGLSRNEA
ncbi:DUF5518 domain-containing protein [Nocardiopsis sp. NRRL B-16309]|uniref:DUF5518 domain-containing protein n=1 Tax=Nocardiopsis sp. NRRL B-16309 TaxID=1519494 RepID=UPI0006AFD736|nr:DUF5518 domain-containing protein [Nocardiopsis sp. NRRL B-16309]KOX16129.1 hypothetical protein ADL05_13070 [Nocardiopsis sp. NRRL B-16309]